MIEEDTIQFGTTSINYNISYSSRKKNATVAVNPSKNVEVIVPEGTPQEDIQNLMKRKAHWILKKQFWFNQIGIINNEKEYVLGETFLYLGRQYRLKTSKGGNKTIAKLIGKYIEVDFNKRTLTKNEQNVIKKVIWDWYREKSRNKIKLIIKKYSNLLSIEEPKFMIKDQKKRWGSCTKNNTLILNIRAIMAPISQLEYIVAHELCHVIHKNHSNEFWDLLRSLIRDYEVKKEALRIDGWKYNL